MCVCWCVLGRHAGESVFFFSHQFVFVFQCVAVSGSQFLQRPLLWITLFHNWALALNLHWTLSETMHCQLYFQWTKICMFPLSAQNEGACPPTFATSSLDSCSLNLNLLFPCHAGCEVNVLPVWCFHPAGGAVDVEHYGGVRLAHLLHSDFQVPGLPGVHQHLENDGGQQVKVHHHVLSLLKDSNL